MGADADVVIAGGGPAGATLAILLGRMGVSVALVEAKRFPREKACGEGVMPAGVRALERMGLAAQVGGARYRGVRYHGFGVVAEATFAQATARAGTTTETASFYGVGQRRLVLDDVLLTAAKRTPGVRVAEDVAVRGVDRRRGRAVALITSAGPIGGRMIVGADGARSTVRQALGLDGQSPAPRRAGLRVHFTLPSGHLVPDMVEVFVGTDHELYLTPLPERQVLVAALATGSAVRTVGECLPEHPKLARLLKGAEAISRPAGRSPLAHRALDGVAPGAVLLGDAAGFTDPLTGGGIAQALLSAELLAAYVPRILDDGGDEWLWRFDRRRRALLRDYRLLTGLLLRLVVRPSRARVALRAMRASPTIMRHLVGAAAGLWPIWPRRTRANRRLGS